MHPRRLPSRIKSRRRRNGTIYLVVISMAMLVGAIGLGALVAARAQVRNGGAAADFAVARLVARSGLDLAMFHVRTDPNWRTTLGNGTWFNNVALGQGAFTVSATDPITGDISVASNHPVVLTSTGTKGSASYKLQVTIAVASPPMPCLGMNMCAGSKISVSSSASLTSNVMLVANNSINNSGTINGNAESPGSAGSAGTINGTYQVLKNPLDMPNPTTVYSYYMANGTAIPYTALLQSSSTQLIPNPSFETNTAGWYVLAPTLGTATISKSSAQKQDGSSSLVINGRLGSGDVPATDLPLTSMRNGDTYALSVPIYGSGVGNVAATLTLQTTSGTVSFSTPNVTIPLLGGWITAAGSITPSWTGTLTKATLTLTTSSLATTLYIDKLSLTDISLPSSAYVMDRVLLSPTSNPYGASTNPQGIYILDCNNQKVTIGPCRIVGTLVLRNVGSNSSIQGPITWEPAVAGYPALLADAGLTINFDKSVGLSEATLGVNFNPSGTPYPFFGGTANSTTSDGYPSIINGLIYCGGDLTFATNPTVTGCVLTAGTVNVNATALTLVYSNASYQTPPPGFQTVTQIVTPQPGTWQRVTQ